jgi:hypothetical protein
MLAPALTLRNGSTSEFRPLNFCFSWFLFPAHFLQTPKEKCLVGAFLALKKCFNPTIIIAIVVGAYFAMIGDALVSFEARQKPAMMQPFVKFDAGMTDALVEFNNFPITVANFSYNIGASAAAGLDYVLVEINNFLPTTAVYILVGIIRGFYDANAKFVKWINSQYRPPGFPQVTNIPPFAEESLFGDILSIQLVHARFRVARDAYASLGMPNATALGIPLYEFATVKIADDMFSVVFALTNIIGSIFLIIGVVLLVMAILQIVAQFVRPFIAGKSLSAGFKCAVCSVKAMVALMKPYIHLPLLFGIGLLVLGAAIQNGADEMRTGTITPLQAADGRIRRDLGIANDWIEMVPNQVISEANEQLKKLTNIANFTTNQLAEIVDKTFNVISRNFEVVLDDFLEQTQLCSSRECVTLKPVKIGDDAAIISSQNWIVSIPRVKFDTFPVDLLSLENIFSPVIDDLHSLLMDIAARIVLIGVICVVVPIYMILSESLDLMQCLPPKWRAMLDVRDFEEPQEEEPRAKEMTPPATAPSPTTSSRRLPALPPPRAPPPASARGIDDFPAFNSARV